MGYLVISHIVGLYVVEKCLVRDPLCCFSSYPYNTGNSMISISSWTQLQLYDQELAIDCLSSKLGTQSHMGFVLDKFNFLMM